MLLKHYLDQGVSKAELSRRFGVSRATIHHWTETGQLDRDLAAGARGYAPRPLVAHKLDPYKAIIDARLEAFPKLSAKRLFDEVRAAGYPGGYGRVRDYVLATRPREPVEAPVRFETPPGHQGQVDFGTFTLPWGRRHALVIVLGYSRLLWLHFYPRQTMGERPIDRFERDERAVLRPLAIGPYRRRGLRQAPEPAPQRLLSATVEVERRPLSVYAEALQ